MREKTTFTCKCGSCDFTVEKGRGGTGILSDYSMAQLHCRKCGSTYDIKAWCYDGMNDIDILETEQ